MYTISEYLNDISEHAPQNVDDIVIKNKFYPRGLTEQQIYDYYMGNKRKILNWIGSRPVAFFLVIDGKIVVKRKLKSGPIILNDSNYEELITGRTVSIYVERPDRTDYFIVDIDAGKGINYKEIWEASEIAQKSLYDMGVLNWEKLFTSPYGMHLIGYIKPKLSIGLLRGEIYNLLSNNQNEYLVNIKGRKPGTINFDLSPNYTRSIHIVRHGLTKEGLICDNIASVNMSMTKAGKTI